MWRCELLSSELLMVAVFLGVDASLTILTDFPSVDMDSNILTLALTLALTRLGPGSGEEMLVLE